MSIVYQNLMPSDEINSFFATDADENIDIGDIVKPPHHLLEQIFSLWCLRIDKLIELDFEVHKDGFSYGQVLEESRGFTYKEYLDLHNSLIVEDEFCHYPIFSQLNRENGGVRSEKQRYRYTSVYGPNEDDYLKCLNESAPRKRLLKYILNNQSVKLPIKEIQKHVSFIAPTSSGKTVLLEYMLCNLTKTCSSSSFVILDPHGELARSAKKFSHLKSRTVYIDPFLSEDYTPCFNPLDIIDNSNRNLSSVVDMLIKSFEEVLTRDGGEITESMVNMLEKALYFLLKRGEASLSHLVNLLAGDKKLASEAFEYDPIFDPTFYLKLNNKTRNGLLNRIGRILNSPILANLLGGKSTFNLEELLNSNKVLIINISSLGGDQQVVFGRLIMSTIRSIIRKRIKPSMHHTYCFIDEVHNFVGGKSDSFEYILSQLRGYGLHMIMANQYPEQFGASLKAVVQNTAIKLLVEGSSYELFSNSTSKFQLGQFEFLLKVRSKPPQVIRSSSVMLDNPELFYINEKQEKLLDKYLLAKYYKPLKNNEAIDRKPIASIEAILTSFDYFIHIN